MRRFPLVSKQQNAPEAQAEIHYKHHDIDGEIARFKAIAFGDFPSRS